MKVGVIEFVKQVRQEASRVTWPTRKETGLSLLMVIIMVVLAGTFFSFADILFAKLVRLFLGV